VHRPPSSPSPLLFPDIGRFKILSQLGEGATGRVFRAQDRQGSRDVALKVLRLPSAESFYRLKGEFRARAGLAHPNLLQLYELFAEGEHCFFTMEVLEGVDFLRWARGATGTSGAPGSTLEVATASTEDMPLPGSHTTPGEEPPTKAPAAIHPSPALSWKHVRRGFSQLLQGLVALHSAGLVHRDVKPSNVLVTPEERVVLLDFGLATELQAPGVEPLAPRRLSGTPAYMAPEQVRGELLTPAADLYAAGALLYEVLTGAYPFSGKSGSLLELKVSRLPPHVLELAPQVPHDLAELAMALLALEPSQRPPVAECLARLEPGSAQAPYPIGKVGSAAGSSVPFVGRTRELRVLAESLAEVAEQQRAVLLSLHGPSGMGKSTLVRHFLASQPPGRAPLVLKGRCHPQESVPYKALDAVIDSLARHLESLPTSEVAALVPARAHALVRLFPVLGRLGAFERAPAPTTLPEPAELRRQGALALRELLERLARGARPLVVWIDDVQWGDADSAPLFEALLEAPAPPLLLLLGFRSEARERSTLLRRLLGHAANLPLVRELPLGALETSEVAELAASLLGPRGPGDSLPLEAVVAQAEGNPFLACELARHFGAHSSVAPGPVDVARLVLERIRALPPEQRALMEVASLAMRPMARSVVLQAAGLAPGERAAVAWLRDSHLLREVPAQGDTELAPYHDRIREALLEALPAPERAGRHRSMAEVLTGLGSEDHEALLLHWEGAGELRQAGHHAQLAAERAARALAFEHAAALYQRALQLQGTQADRPLLLERLAEALANQGQAPEAARRYLEAAGALGGSVELLRVSDMRRRASEQYLKSGHFDEGWHELRSVLQALGVRVPGSFLSAVWAATWRRVLFLLRRGEDSTAPVSPQEQHRLAALWTAATSWSMVNPMLADAFRLMHLLGAPRQGEGSGRAVAMEAAMEWHLGGRLMQTSAQRLLEQVGRQVERTGNPYDRAWHEMTLLNRGYTLGRWREVVEASERAEELFREHCPGSDWERVSVAIFHHHALAMRGELRQLSARLESFAQEAQRRGDLHGRCEAYLGEPVVAWLAQDKAEQTRALRAQALAAQASQAAGWPQNAYRRQQFADLIATVYTAHYVGAPWPAWQAVLEQWKPLSGSFMLALRTTGLNLRHARARAALAAAATLQSEHSAPPEGVAGQWRRSALLRDVRAQLRVIEQDALGCARPVDSLLCAGLAWLEGQRAEAQQRLEEAVAGFEREDMALYREAARHALGAVRGGAGGQALRRQASEWMEAQGVVRPEALAAALVPGVGAWPTVTAVSGV
jgi:eukaryotic-like serine/threonine-protein kinase